VIAIQKTSQESGSAVVFKEDPTSDIFDATARTSRTATLDGGAIVQHYGFADGDLTFRISARVSSTVESQVRTLFENETFVMVATKHGSYYGVISALRAQNGKINMTVLVKD